MITKHTPYWKKRQIELNHALEKDEKAVKKRISKLYKLEEQNLNNQIASYYTRYGENNVIEYRQLLQQLSPEDYQMLMQRMDDFAEKYPQYAHLMPVRESIYKLDRLEGLQYSTQMQMLEDGVKEQAEVQAHLEKLSKREFIAVQEQLGLGKTFGSENQKMIQDIVFTRWSEGDNFSDKIWKNRGKMSRMLNRKLSQGFARGDSYEKMVKAVNDRFHVGRSNAYRLIYTEGTFVQNETRARSISEDFQYYQLSCLPDACDECLQIQSDTESQPVRFDERVEGENFPPIHPWCRCGFEIVVPDRQAWINNYVEQHGGDPELSDETRQKAQEVLDRFTR